MLCILPRRSRSNLSWNKLGCCKLREYLLLIRREGTTPYTVVTSLAAKTVALGQ